MPLHFGTRFAVSQGFAACRRQSCAPCRHPPVPRQPEATSNEVKSLRAEARDLKEALAEQMLENRLLKKSMTGHGGDQE